MQLSTKPKTPHSTLFSVVLRAYIAGLRDQLKEYKVKAEHSDGDPHAHYHGHEKCTHDHGHDHNHGKSEKETDEKDGSCDGHKAGHNHVSRLLF